jgi:hypothetical protein
MSTGSKEVGGTKMMRTEGRHCIQAPEKQPHEFEPLPHSRWASSLARGLAWPALGVCVLRCGGRWRLERWRRMEPTLTCSVAKRPSPGKPACMPATVVVTPWQAKTARPQPHAYSAAQQTKLAGLQSEVASLKQQKIQVDSAQRYRDKLPKWQALLAHAKATSGASWIPGIPMPALIEPLTKAIAPARLKRRAPCAARPARLSSSGHPR